MRRRTFDALATTAGLLILLAIFGFIHLRRTAPEAEIFPPAATRVPAASS